MDPGSTTVENRVRDGRCTWDEESRAYTYSSQSRSGDGLVRDDGTASVVVRSMGDSHEPEGRKQASNVLHLEDKR